MTNARAMIAPWAFLMRPASLITYSILEEPSPVESETAPAEELVLPPPAACAAKGFNEFPSVAAAKLKLKESITSCWSRCADGELLPRGDPFLNAQIHVVEVELRSITPVAPHLLHPEPMETSQVSEGTKENEKLSKPHDKTSDHSHRTFAVINPLAIPDPSNRETFALGL